VQAIEMIAEKSRMPMCKPHYLAAFPRISESLRAKYSISNLYLRPFGLFENDLDVNFNQKLRPCTATQVLQCCTVDTNAKSPDKSFFWDIPVGKRIECLLTLATSWESSNMSVYPRCLNRTCQQQMDISISLQELVNLQHRPDDRDNLMVQVGDRTLHIRNPTGRDQLDWLKKSFQYEDAAVEAMVRTLVLDNGALNQEDLPAEWIQTIDSAMEEFNPLINFNILVHCPYCQNENQYEIDLEEITLRKLRKDQQNLFEVVHSLASHYHWSEEQIFSIPSWRRSHYLALIGKEEDL
jgi:hypothetical protein